MIPIMHLVPFESHLGGVPDLYIQNYHFIPSSVGVGQPYGWTGHIISGAIVIQTSTGYVPVFIHFVDQTAYSAPLVVPHIRGYIFSPANEAELTQHLDDWPVINRQLWLQEILTDLGNQAYWSHPYITLRQAIGQVLLTGLQTHLSDTTRSKVNVVVTTSNGTPAVVSGDAPLRGLIQKLTNDPAFADQLLVDGEEV